MKMSFPKCEFELLPFREDAEYYVPGKWYRIKNCNYAVAYLNALHPIDWWIYEVIVQ